MKRKIIIYSVITLVLVVLVAFTVKLYLKSTKYDHVKSIPSIALEFINGDNFNLKDVNPLNPTIIIFFNPACDICLHEAEAFIEEKELFLNVNLLFVTTADSLVVAEMLEKYPITEIPAAKVLIDKEYCFTAIFKPEITPMCYIYDRDKRLLKTHPGEMKPTSIIKVLSE